MAISLILLVFNLVVKIRSGLNVALCKLKILPRITCFYEAVVMAVHLIAVLAKSVAYIMFIFIK